MNNLYKDYQAIANMTNKEAADILKSFKWNIIPGRGNGKSMRLLMYNAALQKAITALENSQDK